ncbi:MAG: DUF3352 domain-containing protein [Chroococcidiopsidaceae cyanobacterium CP_BM_RX_35]|nr:DUF3352 domain-containing protein [Chroococcidiopsidaceae cyanobacterium CP_BM_RX_35]
MKRRSFFYFLAAGVVVLLLTGISGCQLLGQGSPLTRFQGGNQATPAAAMFVPKQAPAMVSLLVNPDRLSRKQRSLNQLKTNLLASTGLEYQRDLQPWLGNEITLAITSPDMDRNAENGRQPGYLMALSTTDSNKSREFLQALFAKRAIAGTELGTEQYKGVKLIYDPPQSQSDTKELKGLSGAVVGDRFVLFANHPNVLREAINNVQAPDLGLSSSSQYQQALTLLPTRRIGMAFLNLAASSSILSNQPDGEIFQSQLIGLELTSQGFAAKTTLLTTAATQEDAAPPAADLSQPAKALQYVPSAVSLAISGSELNRLGNTNLNQLWTQISTGILGSDSEIVSRLVSQPLAALQTRWGIDLSQDIFSWVQGEYALGLLPNSEQMAPDWVFVVEKSDAATAGVAHLDELAKEQGLSISSLNLGEQKISAWTQLTTAPATSPNSDTASITLKAKVHGVHAAVGNYEILTTSVEAMNAVLNVPSSSKLKASQSHSLLDSREFQASIKPIPQPNKGYLYLDWKASQGILERQLPILKLLKVLGEPFFSRLQSLTISSYGSEKGLLNGGIFFNFSGSS